MWWKAAVYRWLEQERRSQAFLARQADIDPTFLSRCLNDRVSIGQRSLHKLELAMGLRTGTLQLHEESPDSDEEHRQFRGVTRASQGVA